jgi:hypothetical protein
MLKLSIRVYHSYHQLRDIRALLSFRSDTRGQLWYRFISNYYDSTARKDNRRPVMAEHSTLLSFSTGRPISCLKVAIFHYYLRFLGLMHKAHIKFYVTLVLTCAADFIIVPIDFWYEFSTHCQSCVKSFNFSRSCNIEDN